MELPFYSICGALLMFVLWIAATLRREAALLLVTMILLDLGIHGYLAHAGFYQDFSALPPHFALVLVPNLLLLTYFLAQRGVGQRLSKLPAFLLVGFQTFRIPMEGVLYLLVKNGQLPEIMTFTGSNFDLLVGITAPFVALALLQPDAVKIKVALTWNVLGFLILTNTLVHGLLAAPTPFQVFQTTPPNTLIAEFPWIWLPAFIVPCALLGHILSIRQLRASLRLLQA